MTITTEKPLTADDLIRLYSQGVRGELIDGQFSESSPKGIMHGQVEMNLLSELSSFVRPRRLGRLVCSHTGFWLQRALDTVREPDIAFISARKLPLDLDLPGYYEGAPDLAVQIASFNLSRQQVYHKARMWVSFGVPLVWLVDPETRSIEVHRPKQPLLLLTEHDTLDGGALLPGFSCPLRDVFDP